MNYSIREVEHLFGIPASTLRYYEKKEILPSIQKNTSGQRVYSKEELDWLQLVIALKDTGMSIKDIKQYMEYTQDVNSTIEDRRELLLNHKIKVEQKMQETILHLEKINRKLAIYDVMLYTESGGEFKI